MGIVIGEAMACGLPVVAYDLPVYKEIYKQGIITVPVKHFKLFSAEVIGLLENESKKNALAEKGRLQVTKYDWAQVSMKEFSLLKSLSSRNI